MLINNKISRFLNGPYIFFGLIFLFPAILGLTEMIWGIFVPCMFISWFLFGTYSGVDIDTKKLQFREYNQWFGIFKTGKWQTFENYKGVTLVHMNKVYKMYSRSNRTNSSFEKEFNICLVNRSKRPEVVIQKFKKEEDAQKRLDEFSIWLHLPVYSIKD